MRRPLVPVALLYGSGLVLAQFVQAPLLFLFLMSLVLAAAAVCLPRMRSYLLWPFLFFVGWTNFTCRSSIISPNDLRNIVSESAELVTLRGELSETPTQRLYVHDEQEFIRSLAFVEVSEIERHKRWQTAVGRVIVSTRGSLPKNLFAGQIVEINGTIAQPRWPAAEGLFDYRTYLRRQGIHFELRADSTNDWRSIGAPMSRPLSDRFLAWAQATLARGLPQEDEPLRLLWAMTLGWRAGITNEIYEPFMQSGTMHIFAISGLHIALIAGILVAVLRVAQVSRLWCGIVIIPLIWFYTAATGWQPSAIRSTIMMSIIIGGWALNRPSDLLNSLAAAALIILLWDPQQLFQASFQLSFFVVLSIALFLPPLEKIRGRLLQPDPLLPPELIPRWQRWLGAPLRLVTTSLVTSLAAWLGSWPLTAHYFHLFSPVTLLANLLIVPASSAALACNLGSLAFGSWLPFVTELFNHAGWAWMWFMVRTSHWATQIPGAFVFVPSPELADFAIYYGALVAILSGVAFQPKWRMWALAAIPCVALFYGWRWHDAHERTSISVIPLSGGSSTFCQPPNRSERLLVDCGNTNAIEFVIQPFLRAHGVNRLPQLVLTHGDLARVGGAELLRAILPVDSIIVSPVRFRSPTYRYIVAQLEQTPERRRTVKAGDALDGWAVLHPAATDRFSQADDNAMVLRGEFNGTHILLLSDLGRLGQEALLERNRDLRADIVVSGLPAQSEPVSDRLFEAVRPQLIIITDSEFPATRRASAKLQARLATKNVPVIYTRVAGSAKIVLRDNSWRVTTTGGLQYSGQPPVTERSPSAHPLEKPPDDPGSR